MLTLLFDGIAYGMLLFVLSLGLAVTMGLMNFINLAHGAFAMAGGYLLAVLMQQHLAPIGIISSLNLKDLMKTNHPFVSSAINIAAAVRVARSEVVGMTAAGIEAIKKAARDRDGGDHLRRILRGRSDLRFGGAPLAAVASAEPVPPPSRNGKSHEPSRYQHHS